MMTTDSKKSLLDGLKQSLSNDEDKILIDSYARNLSYDDLENAFREQLIASPGNPTPLVRLNRINPNKDFQIYLKLERYNPFGSVKDRIASEMLKALRIGDRTVVEPSSGNTGIALACVANALGIPVEISCCVLINIFVKIYTRITI